MVAAECLPIFKLRLRTVTNRKRNFSQIQFPNRRNATVPSEGRFPSLGHPLHRSCLFNPKPIRPPGFYFHESFEWSCSQYLGVARLISFHSDPKQRYILIITGNIHVIPNSVYWILAHLARHPKEGRCSSSISCDCWTSFCTGRKKIGSSTPSHLSLLDFTAAICPSREEFMAGAVSIDLSRSHNDYTVPCSP